MEDLGTPGSYLTLAEGVAVYSSDGQELGKAEHVLCDPDADVFDGIVLDTSALPGGHRFVDADQVEEALAKPLSKAVKIHSQDAGRPRPLEQRGASGSQWC